MRTHGIQIVIGARLEHLLQIGEIVYGQAAVVAGGRQSATNHGHAGASAFDGIISRGQQIYIFTGVERFVAPFIVQILFVPHFNSFERAVAIFTRHGAHKVGIGARVSGWTAHVIIKAPFARPAR